MERKLPMGPYGIYVSETHTFSMDAVLLAAFASAGRQAAQAVDLCCGCGAVALGLLFRGGARTVTGVELQPEAAALLRRTGTENGLEDRLSVLVGDIKTTLPLKTGAADLVTCNPPFREAHAAKHSADRARAAARGETACTLEDAVRCAARLLRQGGRLALCQRPARLPDCFQLLRQYGLEPKRLRFAAYDRHRQPWLFLVEAVKGGGRQLTVEPLFTVMDGQEHSAEYHALYEGERQ